MRTKTILPLIPSFLSLLLAACSSESELIYIAPGYKHLNQSEVTVAILPFVDKLLNGEERQRFIDRKTLEKKYINAREIELFENYFHVLMEERLQGPAIHPEKPPGLNLAYQQPEKDADAKMGLYIPTSGPLQFNGLTPEYLLLIQDLYFASSTENRGAAHPGQTGAIDFYMDEGRDYLLWDNKNAKVAACGKIKRRVHLFSVPVKEHYLKAFEYFADTIIHNSPLAAKALGL